MENCTLFPFGKLQNGMYLIRRSNKMADQPFTLQIWYGDTDYNLPIKKDAEGYLYVGKNSQVSD